MYALEGKGCGWAKRRRQGIPSVPHLVYFQSDIRTLSVCLCVYEWACALARAQPKAEINLSGLPSRSVSSRGTASALPDAEKAVRYRGKGAYALQDLSAGGPIESEATSRSAMSAILNYIRSPAPRTVPRTPRVSKWSFAPANNRPISRGSKWTSAKSRHIRSTDHRVCYIRPHSKRNDSARHQYLLNLLIQRVILIFLFFFAESWSRCRLDDDQLCARERHRLHETVHELGHLDPLQGKNSVEEGLPDAISRLRKRGCALVNTRIYLVTRGQLSPRPTWTRAGLNELSWDINHPFNPSALDDGAASDSSYFYFVHIPAIVAGGSSFFHPSTFVGLPPHSMCIFPHRASVILSSFFFFFLSFAVYIVCCCSGYFYLVTGECVRTQGSIRWKCSVTLNNNVSVDISRFSFFFALNTHGKYMEYIQ